MTTGEKNKMNKNSQKEVQTKLAKGLLDMIILRYLDQKSMHGYQLITNIRKDFGVYFGPSTIYPLLGLLEKKGYIKNEWNMNTQRPRKVYSLTNDGKSLLSFTESSLSLIRKNLENNNTTQIQTTPMLSVR